MASMLRSFVLRLTTLIPYPCVHPDKRAAHKQRAKAVFIRSGPTTPEPRRARPAALANLHHLDELRRPTGGDSGEVFGRSFCNHFAISNSRLVFISILTNLVFVGVLVE